MPDECDIIQELLRGALDVRKGSAALVKLKDTSGRAPHTRNCEFEIDLSRAQTNDFRRRLYRNKHVQAAKEEGKRAVQIIANQRLDFLKSMYRLPRALRKAEIVITEKGKGGLSTSLSPDKKKIKMLFRGARQEAVELSSFDKLVETAMMAAEGKATIEDIVKALPGVPLEEVEFDLKKKKVPVPPQTEAELKEIWSNLDAAEFALLEKNTAKWEDPRSIEDKELILVEG